MRRDAVPHRTPRAGLRKRPDGRQVRGAAHELLKRVVAAGKCERFQLWEVCPRDAMAHLVALGRLVRHKLVERVTEPGCKWYYRLTPAGVEAAQREEPPAVADTRTLYDEE